MIYIGIDPSLTGTGIVVLDAEGNVLDKALIETKPHRKVGKRLEPVTLEERFRTILESVRATINENSNADEECRVCIEGLSLNSKSSSTLDLAGLHHLIRHYVTYQWHILFSIVPPQALKKFVCGKGNVKKEQMLLQTYKKWGLEFQDNNICDAYCLAQYARQLTW